MFISKLRKHFSNIIIFVSETVHVVTTSIYTYLPSSTTHSIAPLPSGSSSPGHGSLPGKVTQTFIPNGSRSLALCVSGCSFPLILIRGHGNNKWHLGGLLHSRNIPPYPR